MPNPGVVDEDIEASQRLLDLLGCREDGGLVGHIELDGLGCTPDRPSRGHARVQVSRADEDLEALRRQFPGDLVTDALGCACDECDGSAVHGCS